MRNHLLLVLLPVLLLTACSDNGTCTIGNLVCSLDKTKKCVGPDEGGDQDGEFKVVDDCATQGKVCAADIVRGVTYAGCVTKECRDTRIIQCFNLGQTTCALGSHLRTCSIDSAGCQTYVTTQDCSKTGLSCVENDQGAACSM